jgi:hypothetical protein
LRQLQKIEAAVFFLAILPNKCAQKPSFTPKNYISIYLLQLFMQHFHTTYTRKSYDAATGIIESVWQPNTEFMTNEEYQQEMMRSAEILNTIRPYGLLANTQNMRFVIAPDLQQWTGEVISPLFMASGLKKIAFVVPQSFIEQVALQQMLADAETVKNKLSYALRYFDNEKDALAWLKLELL